MLLGEFNVFIFDSRDEKFLIISFKLFGIVLSKWFKSMMPWPNNSKPALISLSFSKL